jgi:hypothetical protein
MTWAEVLLGVGLFIALGSLVTLDYLFLRIVGRL